MDLWWFRLYLTMLKKKLYLKKNFFLCNDGSHSFLYQSLYLNSILYSNNHYILSLMEFNKKLLNKSQYNKIQKKLLKYN